MAKIKIVKFEIISLLSESKKIIEYLQKTGATQFENIEDEGLIKLKTGDIVRQLGEKYEAALKACEILKRHIDTGKLSEGNVKIDYSDYRLLGDRGEEFFSVIGKLLSLQEKLDIIEGKIASIQADILRCKPWGNLDIIMAAQNTAMTDIVLGSFPQQYTKNEITNLISKYSPDVDGVEVEVVSSERLMTCAVIICCSDCFAELKAALDKNGFTPLSVASSKLPGDTVAEYQNKIEALREEKVFLESEIKGLDSYYRELQLFSDYLLAQSDKYLAVENAASGNMFFYLKGYVTERQSEDIKFHIESSYTAQMDIQQPDINDPNVPVFIENGGFASGVESITNMYSLPSNRDVDPNPIMAFFYYLFFGLMLSDGGYGLLMVIFSFIVRKKKKERDFGNLSDMAFWCGVSATFWGALFGSWFGDLIPVVSTEFFGKTAPQIALWLNPTENSITVLLMSFVLGIAHLFAGLGIRFFMLIKAKNYTSAVFDIIPVGVFVVGFAILGGGFFADIPDNIKSWGKILLAIGAVSIVLTSGRSARNIFGKLGMGLYGLYSTASGYLGDILSYSRLLALGLVTGIIASVINTLGAMTGNVIAFALVFVVGHSANLAINLIGSYVHCCRLQYVEFFSKFYEGGGKAFTPFKINSKHFTIKEDNKYG